MLIKSLSNLFCLLLLMGLNTYQLWAQRDREEEKMREFMWGMPEEASRQTKVPEKWKNESAVVLFEYVRHDYEQNAVFTNIRLHHSYYLRRRIKLQDKQAVEAFSEFSFRDGGRNFLLARADKYFFGVKIIKTDGREQVIDLDEAVVKKEKVFVTDSEEKKIAIPDLEPGDILDYYYVSNIIHYRSHKFFDPQSFFLNGEYPTVCQKLELKPMDKSRLNVHYLNGVPELEYDKEQKKYHLTAYDLEKAPDINWFYSHRILPVIRFQVVYGSGSKLGDFKMLYESPRDLKTEITAEELQTFYDKSKIYKLDKAHYGSVVNLLKKRGQKIKNLTPAQVIEEAHDYHRHGWLHRRLENQLFGTRYQLHSDDYVYLTRMAYILDKLDLEYETLIYSPRPLTSVRDVIGHQDLNYALHVKSDPEMYLIPPNWYRNREDIPSWMQGAQAYVYDPNAKNAKMTLIKLPTTSAEQNKQQVNFKLKLDPSDTRKLHIVNKTQVSGTSKENYNQQVINPYDLIIPANQRYDEKTILEQDMGEDERQEWEAKIKQKKEDNRKARIESLEKEFKADFQTDELTVSNFELIETGITTESPDLIFQFEMEASGLVKPAGSNYLISIGKLIGGQVKIEEEDRKRKYDIYMPCARTYEHQIELEIPAGYSVEGLENLQMKAENSTGGFESQARREGNKVLIQVRKHYQHQFEEASQWASMLEFLDLANQFYQQSLLLKKIQAE